MCDDLKKSFLKDENLILRRLLWSMHGHKGIYGDDGEMQCFECWKEYGFLDYKRLPASEIEQKIQDANLMKLANKQNTPDPKQRCSLCHGTGKLPKYHDVEEYYKD